MPTGSIIIPTLGRNESLRDCLESLWHQTNQDFEIIKVTEEGPLAKLRNEGAKRARGKYLIFVDDDIAADQGWFEAIIRTFESDSRIGGVSGPAIITPEFRRNRDIFSIQWAKFLYDHIFCRGQSHLPGHITKAGAWTTGACNKSCSYEGEVHFLEACNMAYRADAFRKCGGFDESYLGIGDWSEPDLSFRVRRAGYKLWFSRDAKLEHRPSVSGAFKKRSRDSANRLANYELFSSRWIEPCWQHSLYNLFLKVYYGLATSK